MPIPGHALMLGGGGSSLSGVAGAIMALGPLGYWKLDEPSGTTAVDSSGNGRNGTYTGTGYTLQGAAGGDGLNYVDLGNGGNSSHIAIASVNVFTANFTPGLTFFMLIKPDSVAGTTRQFIIAKQGTGVDAEWGYAINEGVAASMNGRVWSPAGAAVMKKVTSTNLITTAWQAVAFSHSTVSASNPIAIYRNNNTDISASEGLGSSSYSPATGAVRIGWRGDSPAGQYWAGGMAHVAIFAGQLNSTQIGTMTTAAHNAGWY